MVIEREREIRGLREQLIEANERHDRSIASLESVSGRLEEIQSQARGQATRIRMKALREAVEVGRRAQELTEAQEAAAGDPAEAAANGSAEAERSSAPPRASTRARQSRDRPASTTSPSWSVSRTPPARSTPPPRSRSSASPRAARPSRCASNEPVELLRELEERSPLEFKVRRSGRRQPHPRHRRRAGPRAARRLTRRARPPRADTLIPLGALAEWLRSGLQSRLHRFDSGGRLRLGYRMRPL